MRLQRTAILVHPEMMGSFVIPLAAATLFTVGIYGIGRAEKHAEMLTHILVPVAMALFMLLMIGGLQRAQDAQHTPPEAHRAQPVRGHGPVPR
ncbi:hypothetical protein Q8W71_26125 [Methylobacterium sp. NEAU 140]|uniref:hypothetical protein n=1 Tax=Methylobacterium sp. NEAU 140 TaxID=3064945 RepID=UPI002732BB6C|nr:hypothetical protein [Methylobacterium sp. NEAU 140]MDP4026109.1 hypothetical protein [Methylobacterium sp. NEAU 140]